MNNHALIVLGMHRSGTSAITGILNLLGVQLGHKLYKGHPDINPKGYFENSRVVDINEEALLTLNSYWDDILQKPDHWWIDSKLERFERKISMHLINEFATVSHWAIKDPQICPLLPWWLQILDNNRINAKFLIIIRDPHEVYLSLNKRNGFSMEKSYLLWLLHYIEAVQLTKNRARVITDFDSIIQHPTNIAKFIQHNLGYMFPNRIEDNKYKLENFISSDLKHHNNTSGDGRNLSILEKLANDLFQELLKQSRNHQHEIDYAKINAIAKDVEIYQSNFSCLLIEQLNSVYLARSELQLSINKMFRSSSWTIGKPIRLIERVMGKDV